MDLRGRDLIGCIAEILAFLGFYVTSSKLITGHSNRMWKALTPEEQKHQCEYAKSIIDEIKREEREVKE